MARCRPEALRGALKYTRGLALAVAMLSTQFNPACAAEAATTVSAPSLEPLGPNDVSWLFPVPRNAADLVNFISIGDLTAPDPKDPAKRIPILPPAAFAQFIANANGPNTKVGAHSLQLPPAVQDIKLWRIAGLRIDPGAPGLTPEIIAQYGQQPQLRFILQPVTLAPRGAVKIHDVAAHVIFSFLAGADAPAQPGCLPRAKPDIESFRKLARDFATLRDELAAGQFGGKKIKTDGKLLGVHPGLANRRASKALRDALVLVLERHLSAEKLTGLAVMGLADNGPEPWVFMAMTPKPASVNIPGVPDGAFIPVPGPALDGAQFAEALAVTETPHQVIPTPAPNNLNPITCMNAAFPAGAAALPVAKRKGLATAALFDLGDKRLTKSEDIAKTKETTDLIADPTRSHFFNTDCVSCHTDTRRSLDLLGPHNISGVDPAATPKEKWNVRNFGWFPSFFKGTVAATATRRTAAETEAVVEFINKNGLSKP